MAQSFDLSPVRTGLDSMAETIGLDPFITLAVLMALALGLAILAASVLPDILDSILDSNLPPRARRQMAQARRQGVARNAAAQGRPGIWQRQVRAEESAYVRTLRAQLRAETR